MTAQPTPNLALTPRLWAGMRVPMLKEGGCMSASKINPIVALLNAFSNLKIVRTPKQGEDATGTFILSDQNSVIELQD